MSELLDVEESKLSTLEYKKEIERLLEKANNSIDNQKRKLEFLESRKEKIFNKEFTEKYCSLIDEMLDDYRKSEDDLSLTHNLINLFYKLDGGYNEENFKLYFEVTFGKKLEE